MKRIIFVLFVGLLTCNVYAQHKVESPHPDLKVEIKRAVESTGTAVIDLLITNKGPEEHFSFQAEYSTAYDDEGNQYEILLGIPNKKISAREVGFLIPQNIPVKLRVQVEKVDPSASKFLMVKISVNSNGSMGLRYEKPIVLRNIDLVKQ